MEATHGEDDGVIFLIGFIALLAFAAGCGATYLYAKYKAQEEDRKRKDQERDILIANLHEEAQNNTGMTIQLPQMSTGVLIPLMFKRWKREKGKEDPHVYKYTQEYSDYETGPWQHYVPQPNAKLRSRELEDGKNRIYISDEIRYKSIFVPWPMIEIAETDFQSTPLPAQNIRSIA